MISTDYFLQIADRLAEQYALLNTTVVGLSAPSVLASLQTGLVGSNNAITWTAVSPGSDGNAISVTLVNPGTPSQPLTVSMAGTALTVSLATNGGSALISTA